MPGDATILEGPVTPAPLFAYRAIRSIFFASPDSTPEHYNYNKENIIPAYANSPAKSKLTLPAAPQITTPSQKRKSESDASGGAILSPTKGILRTPGLATPRAKYLRDINVKFKSISPEVRKQETALHNKSPSKTAIQNAPAQAARSSPSMNEPALAAPLPLPEVQASRSQKTLPSAISPSCPLAPAALDAYVAQTEKEMKRLIRYGKKMREYALRKDVENQELRLMVERLRSENERLKNSTAATTDADHDENLMFVHSEQHGERTERRTKSGGTILRKAVSPALRNKNRGHVRDEVDRVETTVCRQTTISRPARSSSTGLGPESTTSALAALEDAPQICAVSPITVHTFPSSKPIPPPTEHPSFPFSTTTPSTPTSNPNTIPATNNGTLRLPPDRAAAARERLRKRAEARKASTEFEAALDSGRDAPARDADADGDGIMQQKLPSAKEKEGVLPLDEPSDLWADL